MLIAVSLSLSHSLYLTHHCFLFFFFLFCTATRRRKSVDNFIIWFDVIPKLNIQRIWMFSYCKQSSVIFCGKTTVYVSARGGMQAQEGLEQRRREVE